jgi:LemA protein
MSSASFLPLLLGALLMFWSVGAYNRLVRLRNAVLRHFVPVEQHLEARSALLQRQIELLIACPGAPRRELQTLQAASGQVDAAWLAARRQPGSAEAINSLRLALQILAQVRVRPVALDAPDIAPALALRQQLAACDNALQFAQGQFNQAVLAYNSALAHFPAAWLGALFGFRHAGPL